MLHTASFLHLKWDAEYCQKSWKFEKLHSRSFLRHNNGNSNNSNCNNSNSDNNNKRFHINVKDCFT